MPAMHRLSRLTLAFALAAPVAVSTSAPAQDQVAAFYRGKTISAPAG